MWRFVEESKCSRAMLIKISDTLCWFVLMVPLHKQPEEERQFFMQYLRTL